VTSFSLEGDDFEPEHEGQKKDEIESYPMIGKIAELFLTFMEILRMRMLKAAFGILTPFALGVIS